MTDTPPAAPAAGTNSGQTHWAATLLSVGQTLVSTGLISRSSKIGRLVVLHASFDPLIKAHTGKSTIEHVEEHIESRVAPQLQHHADVIMGKVKGAREASAQYVSDIGSKVHDHPKIQEVINHPKIKDAIEALHNIGRKAGPVAVTNVASGEPVASGIPKPPTDKTAAQSPAA